MKSKNALQKNRIKEITELHSDISSLIMTALQKAIRIGELLTKQKEELPYGHFTPWIDENLPFTKRSAQEYMRFYDNRQLLQEHHIQNFRDAKKLLQGKDTDTTSQDKQETKHVSLLTTENIKLTKAEYSFIASVVECGGNKDKAFAIVLDRRKEKEEKKQVHGKNTTKSKTRYTMTFTPKERRKVERKAKKESTSIADIIRQLLSTID